MKFLIDECLHTSLVEEANHAGYEAYHVVYYGLQGLKDHELMRRIREEEFVFVTNNASDFRKLFAREPIHSGLVIIVPSVSPPLQRRLFTEALREIRNRDLINMAVQVRLEQDIVIVEFFILSAG
jgi:predicted nuclease of predicted toxin-antitoxin system